MNAVSIGPMMFSSERLAVLLGVVAFLIVAAVLASRIDRRLDRWSATALICGLVMSRATHVAMYIDSFVAEPWRVIAIWQGGFSWIGGLLGVLIALLLLARNAFAAVPWAMMSIAAGGFVWIVATELAGTGPAPPAPNEWFSTLDGKTMNLADRKGRPAVINLWATWCPPCRREMPMMAETARQNPNVDFIFANQGEAAKTVEAYLAAEGIKIDTLVLDQFSSLSRHYAAPGMPTTLFLDSEGKLTDSHLGEISPEILAEKTSRLAKSTENKDKL